MTRLKVLFLILIIGLGFLLRFHRYDQFPRHGATFDEFAWTWQGISLWQTGIPTSWSPHPHYPNYEIKKFQGALVRLVTPYLEHPPLFGLIAGGFALLTGSSQMFDISLSQIRVLALIIGTTTIWLVYSLGRKLYHPSVGLLAALFFATIPTIAVGARLVQNDNFFTLAFLGVWLLALNYLETKKPWQRNLLAIICGLLILAKIPWATATIAVCLLFGLHRRWRDCLIVGSVALAIFSLFFVYGYFYDWPTFFGLWSLQTARAKIGLETTLSLFTHPYLVDRLYPDGWIYFGWLSIALLGLNFKKHAKLLIPILAYFLVFITAIPGIEAQGWYRYPFYPFLIIAAALTVINMAKKPSLLNLIFFFLISASAFHWGWRDIFGMSNSLFRLVILLGLISFLPAVFWPKKFTRLGQKSTYFWTAIFVILNVISIINHVHS